MPRTTQSAVQGILGANYPPSTMPQPDLTPFIEAATVLIDAVETCAINKGRPLTAAQLEMLERYMAAHFFGHAEQFLSSKSTQSASASFQGQTAMGLDSSQYGQSAKMFDPSGCLIAIAGGNRASLFWLGKNPREQIAAVDR